MHNVGAQTQNAWKLNLKLQTINWNLQRPKDDEQLNHIFILNDTTTTLKIVFSKNLCFVVELSGLFPLEPVVLGLTPDVDEVGDDESWKKKSLSGFQAQEAAKHDWALKGHYYFFPDRHNW